MTLWLSSTRTFRHVAGHLREHGRDVPFDLRVVGLRVVRVEHDRLHAEDDPGDQDERDDAEENPARLLLLGARLRRARASSDRRASAS